MSHAFKILGKIYFSLEFHILPNHQSRLKAEYLQIYKFLQMHLLCSDVQKAIGCVFHRAKQQTKKEKNVNLMREEPTQDSNKGNPQDDGRIISSIAASLGPESTQWDLRRMGISKRNGLKKFPGGLLWSND